METEKVITEREAAEFSEFRRERREAEISFTLGKLLVDASRRETDRAALGKACEGAAKLHVSGVQVSPVNVAAARKFLSASKLPVACVVGGTGESLISIKKAEAKRAIRRGAKEIRLVPCYSKLLGGELSYLKREVRRVRRAAKKETLVLSLEDHGIGEAEIALGVRAAIAGHADGVCVRGETALVLCAVRESGGKLRVEASQVENAEQMRLLVKAGAVRVSTHSGEQLAEELYAALERESGEDRP